MATPTTVSPSVITAHQHGPSGTGTPAARSRTARSLIVATTLPTTGSAASTGPATARNSAGSVKNCTFIAVDPRVLSG